MGRLLNAIRQIETKTASSREPDPAGPAAGAAAPPSQQPADPWTAAFSMPKAIVEPVQPAARMSGPGGSGRGHVPSAVTPAPLPTAKYEQPATRAPDSSTIAASRVVVEPESPAPYHEERTERYAPPYAPVHDRSTRRAQPVRPEPTFRPTFTEPGVEETPRLSAADEALNEIATGFLLQYPTGQPVVIGLVGLGRADISRLVTGLTSALTALVPEPVVAVEAARYRDELRRRNRFIVVNAGPFFGPPTTAMVSALDTVVLVAMLNETQREAALDAVKQLKQGGANVAGCIVVEAS